MKTMKIACAALALAVLAGCAGGDFSEGTRTGPHYLASGNVGTADARVYAERTVFRAEPGQEFQFSTSSGEPIPADKVDNYYRLDRVATDFVATSSTRKIRFVLNPATWTFSRSGAIFSNNEPPDQPIWRPTANF
ncbi:MAG: hypothetical protein JST38_20785 [Bacteroidetes bacterium]|nr:hypothetical protein [Bacteroidota bacterium]